MCSQTFQVTVYVCVAMSKKKKLIKKIKINFDHYTYTRPTNYTTSGSALLLLPRR